MTIFRKSPLTAAALGALLVGAISCGSSTPASTTTGTTSAGGGTTTTPPAATTSFRLTKQTDSLPGTLGTPTAGDDAIDGSYDQGNFANGTTWNAGDSLDGGAGTDTLTAQLGANITPSKLNNVEVLSIDATAATTVDLSNADNKLTTIKDVNSAAALTVNNIPSVVANYEMNSTGANNFTATVVTSLLTGAADATTLKLSTVGVATATLGTVAAGDGYNTINLQSNGASRNGGAAGVVTLDDGNGTGLTTVNISGAQDLGLTLTPTTVITLDGSSATGALTLNAAAANGQNMTIKGGSGADVIDPAGYTSNDTINCGGGADRLTLTAAQAAAATVQSNVTLCEVIGLSDGVTATTYTLSNFGATGLRFGANTAGAATVVYPAGTGSLDLQTFTGAGGALTVNHAGSGTADTIDMTIGSTTAGNTFAAAITFGGVETVNLLSQGAANSIAGLTLPSSAGTQTVKVTGNQNLSLITTATTADVLDASGMTGSGAILMGTAALALGAGTNAISITGTANDDRLTGSTLADVLSGGAGADTLTNLVTGGAAGVTVGDSIIGGTGFDTVTLIGSAANAASTDYSGCPVFSDYQHGTTATTTDFIRLSAAADYNGLDLTTAAGGAIASAAAMTIQTVAQNASAAAGGTATLIKLTTSVDFTTTIQGTFNAAIGTATLTATTLNTNKAVTLYDKTNGRMVILDLLNTAGTNTIVETGDVVRCIGTVTMTETEYGTVDADNFAAFL